MINTQRIYPTRYPLFDFHLDIGKFHIYTGVMRPSIEGLSYEYLMIYVAWGAKTLFNLRLYDTERRLEDRLYKLLQYVQEDEDFYKKLPEIKKAIAEFERKHDSKKNKNK